jgi:hypothetical protein
MRGFVAALAVACVSLPAAADTSGNAPDWQQLDPTQRAILAPLGHEWSNLGPERRTKWLELAARYPSMTQDEQARVRARMSYWASLSPEERMEARDRYKRLQSMPSDQRETLRKQWEAYESLSPEERRRLSTPRQPSDKPPGAASAAPVRK